MRRRRLLFQKRTDHLDRPLAAGQDLPARQIERRILRVIAGDGLERRLRQAVDDAADAGWYTPAEIRNLNTPASVIDCIDRLDRENLVA